MNGQDREELTKLQMEVQNIAKQLEIIVTNHLPHILENTGKLKVISPLIIALLILILGLYVVGIWG